MESNMRKFLPEIMVLVMFAVCICTFVVQAPSFIAAQQKQADIIFTTYADIK